MGSVTDLQVYSSFSGFSTVWCPPGVFFFFIVKFGSWMHPWSAIGIWLALGRFYLDCASSLAGLLDVGGVHGKGLLIVPYSAGDRV